MARVVIDLALTLMKRTEKCSLKPYKGKADAPNVWTIGDGHVIGANEQWMHAGITQEQADRLFASDVAEHAKYIEADLGYAKVDDFVFGALASLLYNLGPRGLRGLPSVVNPIRYGKVAAGVTNFYKVNKSGAPLQYRDGLFYRRLAEIYLALAHELVAKPDNCKQAYELIAKLKAVCPAKEHGELVACFKANHRRDLCATC